MDHLDQKAWFTTLTIWTCQWWTPTVWGNCVKSLFQNEPCKYMDWHADSRFNVGCGGVADLMWSWVDVLMSNASMHWCVMLIVNVFFCVFCVDVLMCWCVDVWMCWCVDVLMCGCVDVLMCWCVDVLMCWCVDVLMCWCVCVELMCWCVDVLMCWCVDVLMCWCVDVLMCWCVDVLMCWCVDVSTDVSTDVLMSRLMCWCADCWCVDMFSRMKNLDCCLGTFLPSMKSPASSNPVVKSFYEKHQKVLAGLEKISAKNLTWIYFTGVCNRKKEPHFFSCR